MSTPVLHPFISTLCSCFSLHAHGSLNSMCYIQQIGTPVMCQGPYTVQENSDETNQQKHTPFSQGPASQAVGETCKHIVTLCCDISYKSHT